MSTYDEDFRQKIVSRLLRGEGVADLSRELGIETSTLSTWKTKAKERKVIGKDKRTIKPKEIMRVVVETYPLTEAELSAYCRENGYYIEDVKKWHKKALDANDRETVRDEKAREKLYKAMKDNKRLKKDLKRKNEALAETTALMVLKKNLKQILGDQEDDQ